MNQRLHDTQNAFTPFTRPSAPLHLGAPRAIAPRRTVTMLAQVDDDNSRGAAAIIPARFYDPERARAVHGHRSDLLAPALLRSDPHADAVVESFAHLPAGRGAALLDAALARGIDSVPDAPAALIALFRHVEDVPMWVDWDELAVGGAALMRTGMLGLLTLMCYSLPMAYAVSDGNKPLTFSGKLVGRAARRLNETGRFVIETCRRDGLRRTGEGFRITIKVRLMHAQVRRLLLKSGRWKSDQWGVPINQADMAATNVTFSAVVLRGLHKLGVRMSARERAAAMQLWRYSGHLSGVEPALLTATESEAERLAELMWLTRRPADDDSRQLVRALMGCRLAPPLDRIGNVAGLLEATTRALVGNEVADELELPRTRAALLLPFLRVAVLATEVARRVVPAVDRSLLRVGERVWELVIASGLAGKPAEFRMTTMIKAPPTTSERSAVA